MGCSTAGGRPASPTPMSSARSSGCAAALGGRSDAASARGKRFLHPELSLYSRPSAVYSVSFGLYSPPFAALTNDRGPGGNKHAAARQALLSLALAISFGSPAVAATITGTVQGPDGKPFMGAFVVAENTQNKMTVN